MKKYLVILLCLILCGCSVAEENSQPIHHSKCEHEWVEVALNWRLLGDLSYDVYCPKCELEIEVSPKQWTIIQANMEYRNNNNNN